MKFRRSHASGIDKVEINMTPMIDVVFQLLAFFVMSFKIVSQEGDFNIKMPLAAPQAGLPQDNSLLPMELNMYADASGNLASMEMGGDSPDSGRKFEDFDSLRQYIISVIGDDRGPGSNQENAEVTLNCDYKLKYENVVKAITAISGYRQGDDVVKLVEKIKFAPPKNKS